MYSCRRGFSVSSSSLRDSSYRHSLPFHTCYHRYVDLVFQKQSFFFLLSTLSEIRIIPFCSSLFCSDHLHQSQSSSHLPHNLHLQPYHPHHACCHSATSTCSGPSPHPDSDCRWNLPSPSSHWKHLHPAHSTSRRPDLRPSLMLVLWLRLLVLYAGLSSDEPRCSSVVEPAAGPDGPTTNSDPVYVSLATIMCWLVQGHWSDY